MAIGSLLYGVGERCLGNSGWGLVTISFRNLVINAKNRRNKWHTKMLGFTVQACQLV
jgi:hypothetical protein